jgi:hypothetical protein
MKKLKKKIPQNFFQSTFKVGLHEQAELAFKEQEELHEKKRTLLEEEISHHKEHAAHIHQQWLGAFRKVSHLGGVVGQAFSEVFNEKLLGREIYCTLNDILLVGP